MIMGDGEPIGTSLPDVTLADVHRARECIALFTRRTPLIHSAALSERTGASVHLKLENLQQTGSFKVRGAANRMLRLTDDERTRGVITVSTGNHGRAVAYVANRLGIPAVICMSERVPAGKEAAIRALGAEVVVHGDSYDEAAQHAFQLESERGLVRIEGFDDPLVIAGQGTVGLELLEDLPEIDTAIVPLSGGGLISGIAVALKAAGRPVRAVGVSQDRGPVMVRSLQAGRPIGLPEEQTIADALAGGIGLTNHHTFRMVRELVDETVLVTEAEIADGIVFALEHDRLVIEGGGAVGIAALLHGRVRSPGRTVAVVVSGGNIGLRLLRSLLEGEPRT
jgi:threonine dehydratase